MWISFEGRSLVSYMEAGIRAVFMFWTTRACAFVPPPSKPGEVKGLSQTSIVQLTFK
jgi:hypothetical protein